MKTVGRRALRYSSFDDVMPDVDGLLAYQEGQYQVTGDLEALIDSAGWFPR